jgi:hypothetical protein
MRVALIELGHPQPITGTPFETDNSTAQGCPGHPHFKNATETFEILRHALLLVQVVSPDALLN